MAGNATIGALRVTLGAETAAFDKGLKDAEKSLANFQKNINKVGVAIGAALGGAVVAIGVSIKRAVDEADKLGKMAQSFGIPVEQLSALKLAADLSGVSIEEVGKAVGRLSRSMSEIAGGKATGGAADAFRALAISVKNADGTLKSSTQVMGEVADKFVKMEDGAGKTALAISIFGRAGANLIPLLNQGSKGLRDTAEEAEKLGLIVSQKTAKAAEGFNDNLTRLGKVQDGIALGIVRELAPAFELLTNKIVDYVKANDVAKTGAETMVSGFDVIGRIAATVGVAVSALTKELVALAGVFTATTWQGMVDAFRQFQAEGEKFQPTLEGIRTGFQNFREEARMLAENTDAVANNFKKVQAPVIAAKTALDEFFKSQAKSIASTQADAMAVGLEAGARERLRLVMQAEAIAKENNIKLTDTQRMRITELGNATALAAQQLAGAQLREDSLLPWEQYEKKLQSINTLLQAGVINAQTAARAQRLAAEQAGTAWDIAGASIAGSFAEIGKAFSGESSKMARLAQVFGAVQALISAYTGAAKALELPFPANIAAAAAVLAKGLVFVAGIRSQKIPAMATGGIMRTPGLSGQDSQLMQARVRPDEQIEITRPGEAGPLGGRGGTTIVLQGDSFNRSHIERLVDGINDLMGDRGGIKLATA